MIKKMALVGILATFVMGTFAVVIATQPKAKAAEEMTWGEMKCKFSDDCPKKKKDG